MEVDGGRVGEAVGTNLEGEDDAGGVCRQVQPGLICLQRGRL